LQPGFQRSGTVPPRKVERDVQFSDNMEDKDCASNPDVEHMMD